MRTCFPTYLVVRVFAVLLFISGIIVSLTPAQRLLLVKPMNWERSFVTANPLWKKRIAELSTQRQAEKSGHNSLAEEYDKELSLYIEKKIKGRQVTVSGQTWMDFFNNPAGLKDDAKPGESSFQVKVSNGYFSAEEGIFAQIKDQINLNPSFFYLKLKDSTANSSSFAIEVQKSDDFLFKAPAHMAFPWLIQGLCLVLTAVIIYLLQTGNSQRMPSVRLNPDYTGRGSDLLTAVMVTFMTGIGCLTAANNGFTAFSPAWLLLVGGFTIFASLFSSIWLFTAYYRTLGIRYEDSRVTFAHLFGNTEIDAGLIRSVKRAEHVNPGWMKALLKLGRIMARSKGEARNYEDRREAGFCLILSNGQSSPVMKFRDMTGLPEFFDYLEQAGAEIEAEVRNLPGRSDTDA